MAEITTQEIRDFLCLRQGKEITLADIRREFHIVPGTKSFDAVRNIMFQLAEANVVHATGKRDGVYKVITQVKPVPVFSVQRERRPPFDLVFPRCWETFEELSFGSKVVIREGDLILISGLSNFGKTTLCLNFCGENIDRNPVLMGNEYTTLVENEYKPTPRFMNRLDAMDWVQWADEAGQDKFTLLPVRDDYAEHIIKDRINIIDWINIETGEHYLIGNILEKIKRNLGRGIAIVAIQKGEGMTAGRGGQFTKDFADLELLLDKYGQSDVLLTVGKVKEPRGMVIGNTYAYTITEGVKIMDFHRVEICGHCHGTGKDKNHDCEVCSGKKYLRCD